jgi:RimJ/RimL family protein N-acetyltransferase
VITIVPFQPFHAELIDAQPMQRIGVGLTREQVVELARDSDAYTMVDDERVIAYAGLLRQWDNRAIAWALLGASANRTMLRVHRAVAAYLARSAVRRIEAHVDVAFEAGHRWIELLGFQREGVMRQFTPDGRDAVLYARVR